MNVISFFSRFTLICNFCFLVFIFLAKHEARQPATPSTDKIVRVSYLNDIVITLGISAIIVNLLMCIVYSITVMIVRKQLLPTWLAIVNFLFLILQFLYFFLR